MQLHRAEGCVLIQVFYGTVGGLIDLELPGLSADAIQPIPPALKYPASLRSAFLCHEIVKIKLMPEFRTGHGGRRERDALHHRITETGLLKVELDRNRFVHHAARSLSVVLHPLLQIVYNRFRKCIQQPELDEPIQQVQCETADIQPLE